ncbi:MAG: fatty acid desaturase CarF family protein [Bdellovibrionota bacterium]
MNTPFGPVELSRAASALKKDLAIIQTARAQATPFERREYLVEHYFKPKKSDRQKALVLANWIMAGYLGVQVGSGLIADPIAIIPAALLATLTPRAADFMSAVFHKFLDSVASEQNPIWGSAARAFRVHHEFQNSLARHTYLENAASFAPLMAPLYAAAIAANMPPEMGASVLLALVLFSNGTEIHKQAHNMQPNAFFRFMQKHRMFLGFEAHRLHHSLELDSDYGIINGSSNAAANKMGLGREVDMALWKFFKRLPKNWVQSPKTIPKEVFAELKADLDRVPDEMWVYMQAFPDRSDDEVDQLILESQAWRAAQQSMSAPKKVEP